MVKRKKSKVKVCPPICSALPIEGDLLFCPFLNAPIRNGAEVCENCDWDDKKTEEKLHKQFMKRIKK